MHYRGLTFFLFGAFILFGIYALYVMPKNEFPTFTIRQGVIVAVYPGASADVIEQQVTKPLEKFLWEFKEVKKSNTYSHTQEGICYIFVEVDKNQFKR